MSRAELYLASQAQRARVRAVLEQCVGPENAKHIKELARLAGVKERFLRNAYADFDGVEFVLGHGVNGLYLCSSPDEAESMSRELESRAAEEFARARRRRAFVWPSDVKQLGFSELLRSA